MIGVALGLLAVFAVGVVALALVAWVNQRSARGPWDERPCRVGCKGRHDRYDHQAETPDGACSVLNCPCTRYTP